MSGERNFRKLLEAQWEQGKFLCVGLDSDLEKIPESARAGGTRETMVAFNRSLVDATKDTVGAYKLNSAFYEARGDEGWKALRESIQYILDTAPEIPVILDAKRGDVDNTNIAYAQAVFDHLHADAVTVQPYQGGKALAPFLERKEKGIIVWCRTSNDGAGEFQDLKVDGQPLHEIVASHVAKEWNKNNNCALVVGATYPEELREIRKIVGGMPILIPGVGTQNGDLQKTVAAGKSSTGRGILINASRSIIFASSGKDFAEEARKKSQALHAAIKEAL